MHPQNETPGPGAYGRSLSPKDPEMSKPNVKPGKTFGKSGMTRDNSGIRQLFTVTVPVSTKANTRRSSIGEDGTSRIPREVSLMSLKQKNVVMAAESKTSIHFGLNKSPSMKESPTGTKFDSSNAFRPIVKDSSVTRLPNGPLMNDMTLSTEKLPNVSQMIASLASSK